MKSIEQIKFLKRNISGDRMYNQSNLDQKKEGRGFSEIAAQKVETRMQCAASSSLPRNIKLSSVVKPGRLCSPRPTAARSKTSSTDETDILLSTVSRQSGAAATVTGTASGLFTRLGAPVGRAAALAASPAVADSSWTYCRSTGTDTSSSADFAVLHCSRPPWAVAAAAAVGRG